MKYYWMVGYNKGCSQLMQYVAKEHPFISAKVAGIVSIINWMEITEDEYNLFLEFIK